MMYQGGKARLAGAIAEIVLRERGDRVRYVEPFVGSAAVLSRVAPHFESAVAADAVEDLVLMWRAAVRGWEPPEMVSAEMYAALRNAGPSPVRGFVGFTCSFAGKWFGGFARDPKSDRNFARAGARSVIRRASQMRGVEFRHCDYSALDDAVTPEAVVYCDPPYADTLAYTGAGAFDSSRFWKAAEEWARRGALVLVSEYAAPEGWREVWSAERHTSTARDNRGARAVDRLFMWGGDAA